MYGLISSVRFSNGNQASQSSHETLVWWNVTMRDAKKGNTK